MFHKKTVSCIVFSQVVSVVLLVENELECLESTQSFQAVSKNAETYTQTQ